MQEALVRLKARYWPDHLLGEILSKRWTETAIPVIVLMIVAIALSRAIDNFFSASSLADTARYLSNCGYLGPDPCDGSIGVPVDGTSTCTAAFQVRDSVGAGTLVYDDGRYQASADFTLP